MVPRLLETPETERAERRAAAAKSRAPLAAMTAVFVALPVFNEAAVVARVVDEVARFAAEHPEYRFLFVDDGSTDGTPDVVASRIRDLGVPSLDLYRMRSNGGKGEAVHAAFALAKADVVLFTDGDLAYSLDHLPRLVDALRSADVAIGSRSLCETNNERTAPLRRVMGWTFNRLARVIVGLPYRDTQAGLKGFRAPAAEAIFRRRRLTGFAFDVELLAIARRRGLRIAEIPASPSLEHASQPSNVRMLRDPARMFAALLAVRLHRALGRYD